MADRSVSARARGRRGGAHVGVEKDRLVYDRSLAIHRLESTVRSRRQAAESMSDDVSEDAAAAPHEESGRRAAYDDDEPSRDKATAAVRAAADRPLCNAGGPSPPVSECSSLFSQLRRVAPLSEDSEIDLESGPAPANAQSEQRHSPANAAAFLALRPLRPPSPLPDAGQLAPLHPPPSTSTAPTTGGGAAAAFYASTGGTVGASACADGTWNGADGTWNGASSSSLSANVCDSPTCATMPALELHASSATHTFSCVSAHVHALGVPPPPALPQPPPASATMSPLPPAPPPPPDLRPSTVSEGRVPASAPAAALANIAPQPPPLPPPQPPPLPPNGAPGAGATGDPGAGADEEEDTELAGESQDGPEGCAGESLTRSAKRRRQRMRLRQQIRQQHAPDYDEERVSPAAQQSQGQSLLMASQLPPSPPQLHPQHQQHQVYHHPMMQPMQPQYPHHQNPHNSAPAPVSTMGPGGTAHMIPHVNAMGISPYAMHVPSNGGVAHMMLPPVSNTSSYHAAHACYSQDYRGYHQDQQGGGRGGRQ